MSSGALAARLRAAILLIFIAIPLLGSAQVSRTAGIVQGVTLDQTGGAIAGAHVRLTNTATNQERTTTTDPAGSFLLTGVPVGLYRLTVEATGFARYENDAVESSLGAGDVCCSPPCACDRAATGHGKGTRPTHRRDTNDGRDHRRTGAD
jgi:hypothetical protein